MAHGLFIEGNYVQARNPNTPSGSKNTLAFRRLSPKKGMPLAPSDKLSPSGERLSLRRAASKCSRSTGLSARDMNSGFPESVLGDLTIRLNRPLQLTAPFDGIRCWHLANLCYSVNYTRLLCIVLNKSRKQHSTKQQLYDHFTPSHKLSKTNKKF